MQIVYTDCIQGGKRICTLVGTYIYTQFALYKYLAPEQYCCTMNLHIERTTNTCTCTCICMNGLEMITNSYVHSYLHIHVHVHKMMGASPNTFWKVKRRFDVYMGGEEEVV